MNHEMSHDSPELAEQTGPNKRLVVACVAAVCALIFILQNTEKGNIEFLFIDWTVGIWFGLLVAFLLGTVTGWFLPKLRRRQRRKASKG
jgi:uncharacterized integral membrane protein